MSDFLKNFATGGARVSLSGLLRFSGFCFSYSAKSFLQHIYTYATNQSSREKGKHLVSFRVYKRLVILSV